MANFPKENDLFVGRYRVDRLLGSGGFARVYAAVQQDLDRHVAIKILAPKHRRDTKEAEERWNNTKRRFLREARLVSQLRDPHTITMFDYGETGDGLMYMVFELVEGFSLAELLKNESVPLEEGRVIGIVRQVLLALEEAHALDVFHRDIKPANIMIFDHVSRRDRVKVLDFGIAKSFAGEDTSEITREGSIVGTPRYMSPEQIRGQELTPATDIYSLGLVAFELLSGRKAIVADSSLTIISEQLDATSFALPSVLEVSPTFRTVVDTMLLKPRTWRYETARQVIDDLDALVAGKPIAERAAAGPAGTNHAFSEAGSRSRRSRSIGMLIALGVVVIALASYVIYVRSEAKGHESVKTVAASRAAERAAQNPGIQMELDTEPTGATIYVAGEPAGRAPVLVNTEKLVFPLTVRAEDSAWEDVSQVFQRPSEKATLVFVTPRLMKSDAGVDQKRRDVNSDSTQTGQANLPAVVSAEKRAKQANKRRETRQKKPAKIVSKTVEKAETVELPAEVKPSESEKPPTSLHLVPLD